MGADHPGTGSSRNGTAEGRGVEKYLGQRFGLLTAISLVWYKGRREMMCRCDCGTEKVIAIRRLVRFSRSCGCLNRAQVFPVGTVIGSWTIGIYGRDPATGRYGFQCRCACGAESFVEGRALRSGRSTMCRTCSSVQRSRPDTQSNNIWHQYRIRAKKKGIPFDLTQKYFRDIITQNCTYCGCPPQSMEPPNTSYGQDFYHNGIDRQDNTLGYVASNCVPCCSTCNYMKSTRSSGDFVTWAVRVAAGSHEKKEFPLTEGQARVVLQGYRSRAKRKGFPFTLDEKSAQKLLSHSCSYCGSNPNNSRMVSYKSRCPERFSFTGIDRVDPSKGYVDGNCRSACWACNNAKRTHTLNTFLTHVQRIVEHQQTSNSTRYRNT